MDRMDKIDRIDRLYLYDRQIEIGIEVNTQHENGERMRKTGRTLLRDLVNDINLTQTEDSILRQVDGTVWHFSDVWSVCVGCIVGTQAFIGSTNIGERQRDG